MIGHGDSFSGFVVENIGGVRDIEFLLNIGWVYRCAGARFGIEVASSWVGMLAENSNSRHLR